MASQTVTNQKTTFDGDANLDYPVKITNDAGAQVQHVISYSALIPKEYDYISLGYTGGNLTTAVYKTGGSGGTTVATLTLAYSGSVLSSVTRT